MDTDMDGQGLMAEYLRLRCGMLDLIDGEMYGRGLAAGAACGAAEEAYGAARRPEWVHSIALGVLARREPEALARWAEEWAAVERWVGSEEWAALPEGLREWVERDLRRARRAAGAS